MSSLNLFDTSEQICYVQCGFCSTILLVSVPCNISTMVVTVRCGHCSGLLSVNMTRASFVPYHLLASLTHQHEQKQEELEEADIQNEVSSENEEFDDIICMNQLVNKPPEKRQRTPSAYNRFIREEIKRLKAENPKMIHKEAFSTAAKNWANFPPIDQYNEDGENFGRREQNVSWDSNLNKVHKADKVFSETKLGHEDELFIRPKTPFN